MLCSAMTTVTLTPGDTERPIPLQPGDSVQMLLPEDPAEGQVWTWRTGDGVHVLSADLVPTVDGGTERRVVLRVAEPGRHTVLLECRLPLELRPAQVLTLVLQAG